MLAGVVTGLVLHFARDIAEGYPGVRLFWTLQDTSWMASYRWFLGMIVVFMAARLVLVTWSAFRARVSPSSGRWTTRRPSPPHRGLSASRDVAHRESSIVASEP